MRLSRVILPLCAFSTAALLSILVAVFSVTQIEVSSRENVKTALLIGGEDWAQVTVDGLEVSLTGTAPTEAARFRALTTAASAVDSTRLIDAMTVADTKPVTPPHFGIEILRNSTGISLIGLMPTAGDHAVIGREISQIAQGAQVADMLATADYPVPSGWDHALSFGIEALRLLPKTKISITANKVAITAMASSATQRRQIEDTLSRRKPEGVTMTLKISAPRPAITPFTLRFVIDANGARFDACAADTKTARQQILKAAHATGLTGGANCTLGLGVPSPHWADAVSASIKALKALGGGALTFSDADISLRASAGTPQATFDRIIGELQSVLPKVFSLHAILPSAPKGATPSDPAAKGPSEFSATRSPEGLVDMRGRLTDARQRAAVTSYARARFGGENVHMATRLDAKLPDGWPTRVLAGLDALSQLRNGSLVVQPTFLKLRGLTEDPDARANISRILSKNLGTGADYKIDVIYRKKPDPIANRPSPKACVASVNAAQSAHKITFAPGSATMEVGANATIDKIAGILKTCPGVKMEIGGHTDSQGRESMNEALSQSRAEAVLSALMARRVLTAGIEAKGYGESQPIADNTTDAGRETNRRIEFKLITQPPLPGINAPANDTPKGDTVKTTSAKTAAPAIGLQSGSSPTEAKK